MDGAFSPAVHMVAGAGAELCRKGEGAGISRFGKHAASQCTLLLCTFAGAFPSAKGEGFEQGADWPEQRRGFRGNSENAKTKLCMRYALTKSSPCYLVKGLQHCF